jgi:hypothetical protein
VRRLERSQGNWYFLFVKTDQKINRSKVPTQIIEERELVWKLFNSETRDK